MINGPVWNEAEIQPGDTPTVLAIGDSWFWYPRNNLAIPLHRILNRSSNHVILVRGHNGAEAVEYENGPIRKQIEWDLDKKIGYGRTIRAVFLSGGGNDFAGRDDMRALLKGDCSSLSDPSQCFRASQPAQLFEAVQKALLSVVDLVAEKLPGGSGVRSWLRLCRSEREGLSWAGSMAAIPDGRVAGGSRHTTSCRQ